MANTAPTAITQKAYDLAKAEADARKEQGLSSSISAVVSEAVVEKFGKETK